jgi:hypothetical protein
MASLRAVVRLEAGPHFTFYGVGSIDAGQERI